MSCTAEPPTVEDCGWPPEISIAFQGWATEDELGLMESSPTRERFYWLVTAEPVSMTTSQGSGTARVACFEGQDGLIGWQVVPDDWEPPGSR